MYSTMQLYIYIYTIPAIENERVLQTLVFSLPWKSLKPKQMQIRQHGQTFAILAIYIYYVMIIITLFQCVSIPMDAHVQFGSIQLPNLYICSEFPGHRPYQTQLIQISLRAPPLMSSSLYSLLPTICYRSACCTTPCPWIALSTLEEIIWVFHT